MINSIDAFSFNSIICAPATAAATGAIAIIRISGKGSVDLCSKYIYPVKKGLSFKNCQHAQMYLSLFKNDDELVDEVLSVIFYEPASYTGEETVEVYCHGSKYIQHRIMEILISAGARLAKPGEFTMRAFLNGKLDLSQAEAVADLIAANSKAEHDIAYKQMRGGFSSKIKELRSKLVNIASLIELELDFSEEDVEFVDRNKLIELLYEIEMEVEKLINSFSLGNVIKKGIPVAIIGKPNVGKSTLLNALLNEERALVSELPGTTRDTIEDVLNINGINFRFIDTAGLRHANDKIESMGIEKTIEKIKQAMIILFVFDINETTIEEIRVEVEKIKTFFNDNQKRIIVIANKTDCLTEMPKGFRELVDLETIFISAKRKENINLIIESLLNSVDYSQIQNDHIISNIRHLDALTKVMEMINTVKNSIQTNISTDLIAEDLRMGLHYLGTITGEVTSDELLQNIFSNFCIGK